jgi:AcrR family transcriptional regulator
MAHPKQLEPAEILKTALGLLEEKGPEALSLRAIAGTLGVKAPSIYHHFGDKAALERALIAEGHVRLLEFVRRQVRSEDPETAFREMAAAYLKFARRHPALYFFTTHDGAAGGDASAAGKELWNFLLARVGALSGDSDDTSGAVAAWAFLHGYAVLERSGRFGKSGPREGLERGLEALISCNLRLAVSVDA